MAGPSTSYRISQTVRAVTCRQCTQRLDLGDLRVDTLRAGQVRACHHAECFVRVQTHVRIPEDLDGWSNLASDLKRIVLGFKGTSGTSSQPTPSNDYQSTSTCPQTSSTPVRNTPSSQNSQHQHTPSSQPVSVIVSRSDSRSSSQSNSQQLINSPLSSSQLSRHTSTSSIIDLTDINSDGDDHYDSYDSYDDEDDDEESLPSQDPKRPRLSTDSQGNPVMPDLLAGVTIPAGPARTGDECCVCLEPPLHPVTLPCGHVFCFLCAKGLTRQGGVRGACSLCRQDIPDNFLDDSQVISGALDDVDSQELAPSSSDQPSQSQAWSWFYEGRNGWWRFEERCNEDLETTFLSGNQSFETIICGQLYVIDFVRMEQYQKNYPTRKRKIKRDLKTSDSKGIAGLQASKRKTMSQGTQ